MTATPILMAWSGGKDCLMALDTLQADPEWRVVALLTTVNRVHDRVAMHGIRREVLHAQASALGLPLIEVEIDWPSSNADYEKPHAKALQAAGRRWPGLHHCAYGDLFLDDVRDYRIRQLGAIGWRCEFPIWGRDTAELARHFVSSGFCAHVCCVDTEQLDADWCGRPFDAEFLDTLPAGIDPCGERGEFHSLACDGPPFRTPIRLQRGESLLRDKRFQFTDFLLA